MNLWKEKCKVFVKLLEESYSDNRIVLIKSRLALKAEIGESYKSMYKRKDYKIQCNYSEMEQYFQSLFKKEIQVYEVPEEIYSSDRIQIWGRTTIFSK